jgi:tetratricopeptide (TPR) repeat protein
MDNSAFDKKKMLRRTMLAKIEDVLKRGRATDSPAYTLILGAGASFGVVPTAKEMLGFRDARTKSVHERSIPVWLASLDDAATLNGDDARIGCSSEFWKKFIGDNADHDLCKSLEMDPEGFPKASSVSSAYQSVFETGCVGGLDTPERHRNYMRAVTMSAALGHTQLNATHFYLASLLSLQRRATELGSDKRPLYTGRREFARTIFTTNFDPLLQTSLQLFQLLYYMTDRPESLPADALQTDQHPAIHLFYAHGSVHRPFMANTPDQIASLKQQNARDLAAYLGNHGVIVLGYSGWDDCLLEALKQTKTFSNNLYWLARGADSITEDVRDFLVTHSNAYWVQIDDADNFMAELHSRLCPGAPNTEMLYNPIRPLLSQLTCVNLAGIQAGGEKKENESAKTMAALGGVGDIEAIRRQVIERLENAQRLFSEPSTAGGDLEELERQASLSFANRDWQAAWSGYNRLLSQAGLSVDRKARALFRRGFCYGEKGEIDKEIADYSAVIELPGAPVDQIAWALYNRGIRYGEKGEVNHEIADYSAVIDLPEAPVEQVAWALYNRGIRYGEKGKTDEEIADYSALIDLPDAPGDQVGKARYNRGVSYSQKGETEKAIADYSAVIEMVEVPIDLVARARNNRGVAYAVKGETDKEIADFSAVINLAGAPVDQLVIARNNRAIRYGKIGEIAKQIADYTAVIELPGTPVTQLAEARYNRGICHEMKMEVEKAVGDYSAVISLAGAPEETVAQAKTHLTALQAANPNKTPLRPDANGSR